MRLVVMLRANLKSMYPEVLHMRSPAVILGTQCRAFYLVEGAAYRVLKDTSLF